MQARRSKFPIEVKSGSSVVKIYADKRSDGREIFQVGWYLGGRRLKQFNDLRAAKGFAKQQADDLRRKTSSESSTRNQVLEYSEAKRLCGNESLITVVKECRKEYHHGYEESRHQRASSAVDMCPNFCEFLKASKQCPKYHLKQHPQYDY